MPSGESEHVGWPLTYRAVTAADVAAPGLTASWSLPLLGCRLGLQIGAHSEALVLDDRFERGLELACERETLNEAAEFQVEGQPCWLTWWMAKRASSMNLVPRLLLAGTLGTIFTER